MRISWNFGQFGIRLNHIVVNRFHFGVVPVEKVRNDATGNV